MTEREAEMYVQGVWDLFLVLGGDGIGKSYDPLTFSEGTAHSYILDLWDGGRHHDMAGKTPDDVADRALLEISKMAQDELVGLL